MNEVKTISPFKNFCVTVGNLPTSYLESMSYYETLCWLCKYLENTINPAINNNAEALKELQEYVANYFDNLDVTEEIDAKLDEMALDGTLGQIINVEMIGSLSDLTTTDKSDLVSAINETNMNLVNVYNMSENELQGDATITDFYSATYAWSQNSTWFKFFCDMVVQGNTTGSTIVFPLPSGFTVTETYTIRNAGTYTINGLLYGNAELTVSPAGLSISYSVSPDGTPIRVTLNPYLYYNGAIEL